MHSNEIIGYRVQCEDGLFVCVHAPMEHHFLSSVPPTPISRPDAYRRLAGFLDENPKNNMTYEVVPVYREYTPIEKASKDLSARLKSLCTVHGLRLGMTDAQIEAKIAKELEELGASPVTDQIYASIGR